MESNSTELAEKKDQLMLQKKINDDLKAKFIKMKDELQAVQKEKEEVSKELNEVKKESLNLEQLIKIANANLTNFFADYNKNSNENDINISWLRLGIGKDGHEKPGKYAVISEPIDEDEQDCNLE